MKTNEFYGNYEAIKLFCKLSSGGFVVAEINDYITKNELIENLKKDFNITVVKLNDFEDKVFNSSEFSLIVIDEFNTLNAYNIASNLNYNRNWFLSLKINIIIIASSSTVDELINYSSSFWSFVSLHKIFVNKFKCIFDFRFISGSDIFSLISNNNLGLKHFIIQSNHITKKQKINSIAEESFHQKLIVDDVVSFLKKQLSLNGYTKSKSPTSLIVCAISFGEKLLNNGFFAEAKQCADYLYNNYVFFPSYIEMQARLIKLVADANYSDNEFDTALQLYNVLINWYESKYLSYDVAAISVIYNNCGVIFSKQQCYSEAISVFYDCYKMLKDSENIQQLYILIHVFYNLSLVHNEEGDYHNSLDYIDNAMEYCNYLSENDILNFSSLKVFKAYLLINRGSLSLANSLLKDCLEDFRRKMDENSISIMEAHYVYALYYLYINDLDKAYHCASNANQIAKNIKAEQTKKTQIRELIGKILFYQKKYHEALPFLTTAYNHGKKLNLFSDDVLEWIKDSIEKCKSSG